MDNKFMEYSRSAAFRVDLSPLMVDVLLLIAFATKEQRLYGPLKMHPYHALERRGLIEWRGEGMKRRGPFITEAGTKMAELLELAGFSTVYMDDARMEQS